MVVASCAAPAPPPTATPTPTPPPAKTKFIFAALPPGTSYYLTAVGLAQLINRYTDLHLVVQPVPGVKPQLAAIVSGDADINFNPSQVWSDAFYGGRLYSLEKPAPRARFLIVGHNNYLGFMTGKKSGIETMDDLRGKRVVVNWPRFLIMDTIAKAVLRAYGIDPEKDIVPVTGESPPLGCKLLQEGKGDAAFNGLGGAMMVEANARIATIVALSSGMAFCCTTALAESNLSSPF